MIKALSFTPFPAGAIKPDGWLKKQLHLQAEGLAGNLDKVWPDIKDSMWIGGSRNDWERVPYWLDGFIPLAWLLDNEDMKARAKTYVDGIVARQCEDGWLCPCRQEERHHYDTWAALLLCKVLALYCDCTGDHRVENALYKALKQFSLHLDGTTLHNWGAARWFEGLIPIFWLYERCGEDWLILLAKKLNVQGFDWEKAFDTALLDDLTESWDYISHVVNIAMMLRSRTLMSRITGEDPDLFAQKALAWLREHHGMANGHFTGDENLSGNSPVQGSELCSVVEAMYSYETLFSVSGNPYWLEQLEKEAFNALPATVSPDMWTHQYVQLTNQVECSRLEKRVFRSNNEEAHLFGLEPHFGCCTANMGQGFPKLALHTFMKTPNGLAVCLPLPATITTTIGGAEVQCTCLSQYPFRETVTYRLTTDTPVSFPLTLYIPAHIQNARLDGENVQAGTLVTVQKTWTGTTELTLSFSFESRFESRPNGMLCLWRGPLLYSLPIEEKWVMHEYEKNGVVRQYPYCDYELFPQSDWNYGFLPDQDPTALTVTEEPYDAPFTPQKPPVRIAVSMAKVAWSKPDRRCAPLPDSCKAEGAPVTLSLIPYGCTNLRMTEMPLVEL